VCVVVAEYGTILDMKINRNRNSVNNLPVCAHFYRYFFSTTFFTEFMTSSYVSPSVHHSWLFTYCWHLGFPVTAIFLSSLLSILPEDFLPPTSSSNAHRLGHSELRLFTFIKVIYLPYSVVSTC